MNIIFIAKYFYPHIGGVEKHVLELSREFIKKGNTISILTEKYDEKLIDNEKYDGIHIYRIKAGSNNWFKKFYIWFALLNKIKLIYSADIIHCHDVFFWYLPFRFIFFWKKVYVTFHGYESFPIPYKNVIYRKITEILTSGNICIGEFMKKWYMTSPTLVSYGAVSIPKTAGIFREKYSALFYGRLDEQTGIMEYVKAISKIQKKYPKFKLKIIGDGKFKKLLKKEDIENFRKAPEKELSNHRYAFLSRYLSILEALAAKRLVFALYDNHIKEDYLKMSPFSKYIVISQNASDLAKKVMYYISNPKMEKEIVEKGYIFAKECSWRKLCSTYQTLWNR